MHSKTKEQIIKDLNTSPEKGLTLNQIKKRQQKFGPNKFTEKKPPSAFIIFLKQFNNIFTYILLAAAIVSFLMQENKDAIVILMAILINVIIGFIQESKAQNTITALKKIVKTTTKVLRDNQVQIINAKNLVPGDIILIDAGDKIPADARLIKAFSFQTDEAALTGESKPEQKKAQLILQKNTPLGDRENMIYMGTIAVAGKAKAVVISTGDKTEIGKISALVKKTKEDKTPLQKKIKKLSFTITIIISILLLIIIIGGLLTGRSLSEMFIFAVAIAVGAIPEGLLIAVTVILTLGMRRILQRKALVRELLAAETLGSTTIICADKTGTITTGKMTVEKIVDSSGNINQKNDKTEQILKIGLLCNDVQISNNQKLIGDPTEIALVHAAQKANLNKKELTKNLTLVNEIPFDPYAKFMSVAYETHIYTKGATEQILNFSNRIYLDKDNIQSLTPEKKQELLEINNKLSQKGYRVLSCAYNNLTRLAHRPLPMGDIKKACCQNLIFAGLVAIRDPIRPGVKEAIQLCQQAGIEIKMITGDHKLTAQAIGQDIGLTALDNEILTGKEFNNLSYQELKNKVPKTKIFARVEPKNKLQIIDILQAQNKIVAMTGDGVNDAPALKSADIGIALGSGTEVAKDTSDIILLDNNFKSIERAVEEGRGIFDNIRKVVLYLFSDIFQEVILVGGSLLLGLPLLISPIQILWVNIVEDSLPSFALAFEEKEKDVMKRPPFKLREPILNSEMKTLLIIITIISDCVLLALGYYFWKKTGDLAYTRSIVFIGLAIDSLFFIYNCRSLRKTIWQFNPFSNKFLVFSTMLGLTLTLIALYIPFFQDILGTVAIGINIWLLLLGIGIINMFIVEIIKYIFIVRKKV